MVMEDIKVFCILSVKFNKNNLIEFLLKVTEEAMAVVMEEATEAVVDLVEVEVEDTEEAAVSEVDSGLEADMAAATANNHHQLHHNFVNFPVY